MNGSLLSRFCIPYLRVSQRVIGQTGFAASAKRSFSVTHQNFNNQEQQTKKPFIYFVQNPITWVMNKLDFYMLRRTWDPSFNEKEFLSGVKTAVCTVTQLLSENKIDELNGMLSKECVSSTRKEMETNWSDEKRRNLGISEGDIQAALPRRVQFKKHKNQKFCDIDTIVIALKSDPGLDKKVIFIEVNARFRREYSEFSIPDWTITLLLLPRFDVINIPKD